MSAKDDLSKTQRKVGRPKKQKADSDLIGLEPQPAVTARKVSTVSSAPSVISSRKSSNASDRETADNSALSSQDSASVSSKTRRQRSLRQTPGRLAFQATANKNKKEPAAVTGDDSTDDSVLSVLLDTGSGKSTGKPVRSKPKTPKLSNGKPAPSINMDEEAKTVSVGDKSYPVDDSMEEAIRHICLVSTEFYNDITNRQTLDRSRRRLLDKKALEIKSLKNELELSKDRCNQLMNLGDTKDREIRQLMTEIRGHIDEKALLNDSWARDQKILREQTNNVQTQR